MIDIRYDAHFDFMRPRSLSFLNYFHSYSVELRLLSFNLLILHFSFLALFPFIFPFYFIFLGPIFEAIADLAKKVSFPLSNIYLVDGSKKMK